ncbi:MAG: LamG domain-containing protein, partial [Gemmatimonadetes bacterium]
GLGLISAAWAQNPDVVITYGSTTNVTNGSLYGEVTIGQTLVGSSSGSNNAIAHGLWGLYLREPLPIQVNASQGDYPDQIVVEWNLDGLSAVADAEIAYKLYRNNALVAELSADQRRFVDTNVLAGIFYTYEVEGINEFGTSQRGAAVGFVNPNGVITGNISTTRGTPMADVEVSVLPNLGQALQFDGIDDYAQIPADTLMNTESFTLEFWFRAAANRAQGMFRKGFRVMMNDANGVIEFDTPGNIGNLTSNPTTIGEWNHVAVTFDAASQTAKLYLNAALQDSATGITSMNGASGEALKIGTDGSSYFQGNIDDVRLWNVARSQADIARHKGRTVETFEVDNGLVGYWKFDEGILDYVFDLTEHDLDGRTYGPTWTNQKADVRTSAFTDLHGNYIIEGVNYGNGTTFTVTPRKIIVIDDTTTFEHSYNPEFRYVTLNPSNTARDQIDFNDISLVPVSGFVRYAAHPDCPVDSAEILQDGDIFRPQVFTEEDGSFLVELIPGTSPRLTVRKDDHRITLENGALFFQPQNITQPIANVLFLDQTRRSITVDVVGGQCNQALTPIPGTEEEFTVTVNSIPSCLSRQLVVDGTRITFENLPPLNYEVTVQHPDPVVTFEGRQISVVDTNKSMEFRFRNDPVVDLQIMGANEACSNLTGPQGESLDPALILIQDKEYLMNIRVYEDYSRWGGGQCNIDSGSVTLSGQFFGTADTTMTFDNGGLFGLTFSPGPPNILSGGAHPYQKSLSVIARDDLDRSAADEEWVYIAGHRPRSQTFTTVTPELPLYILRDPPGDLSYSYLSEGMSLTTSTTLSTQTSSSIEDQLQIKLGADFSVSTGVGVETEIEFETELNETITANMTNTITNSSTWTQTMTMTETFNTADDGNAPGPNSDLYIGGARNMLYGLTDVLSYNDTTCTLVADTTLMMVPGSFATFYIYTDAQIKGYIIPPLESFVAYYQSIGEEDSAAYYQNQIDVWRQVLDLNHELKQTAVRDPLRPNVSFDAMSGAYQSEIETSISESRSISYDIQIEESVAMELGFEVEGIGESFSMTVTSTVGETTDESIETEYTTTVGYVLDDDDPGDFFSVDILKDPVYGTPVFKLRAGNSSCPWEQAYTHTTLEGEELVTPGTLPREGLSISVSPSSIVGLQPTEPAEFTITLGNTSESGELMRYNLEEWIPSNPYGAVMRINGSPIQDMVFTMNAGEQIDLTLTVEPGPTESIYHDMQLRFFSECEEEVAGALNIPNPIQDFATFSVEWIDPCTPVVLDEPQGSFFITPDDNNQLNVTITGYNTDEPNFRALRLQYRPRVVIGNSIIRSNREESGLRTGEWILATEPIPKDSLHFDYVIVPWDVSLLDDGEYEIRVVSECTGDDPSGVSGIVPGTIQRRPPGLLGEPEPVDGVLSENDQIILSFDEPINCQAIDPLFDLELIDMTNGGNVVYEWSCNDNQIIFTIPFDYNRFYENHTLRAKAKNIEDTYFNRMAPADSIMWEFLVDRNRIRWTNTLADVIKWEDETTSFTRQLINNGGATMEFELVDVPNWLTPSHYDGILAPGNSLTITFTINDQIGGGHYNHQVKARTDFG